MSSPTATATSNGDDSSDDAPEEFTSLQGLIHSQEIAKAQQHSLSRARRDLKDRRKKRAQRLTPKSNPPPAPADDEMVDDDDPVDSTHQSHLNSGMLSNHIISFLAARQKQVFLSDSDEERTDIKPKRKKKKANLSGIEETVILKDLPPSHCVQSSLEFLNKRKMQAPRSSAILNNSNQALRLLSSSGLLK